MPAVRLFDIYNAFIAATQLAGIETLEANFGYRTQQTRSDGGSGVAARDKLAHFVDARMAGEDITTFPAIVALFEAVDGSAVAGLTVKAEGRKHGTATGSLLTLPRQKLVGATLDFRQGAYAKTTFDFRNSAAAASSASKDEVTNTDVAIPAITHSSVMRGLELTSASFDPNGAAPAITPLNLIGLSLAIRWANDTTYGDSDFGESVEVGGWEMTGALTFKDVTLATGSMVSQELIDAVYGQLSIGYVEQLTGTAKTLTIENVNFETDRQALRSNVYHEDTMAFGVFSQVAGNFFTVATGANKILAVA